MASWLMPLNSATPDDRGQGESRAYLWNGRVTANGHHDEAPEPQQTLFSWAEFMAEEPVKPKNTQAIHLSGPQA